MTHCYLHSNICKVYVSTYSVESTRVRFAVYICAVLLNCINNFGKQPKEYRPIRVEEQEQETETDTCSCATCHTCHQSDCSCSDVRQRLLNAHVYVLISKLVFVEAFAIGRFFRQEVSS